MTEPSLALQGAIVARLKADTAVAALVGARIYDRVPASATFPYIAWGPDQVIDDSTDCHDDVEVFTTLDIWSRAIGRAEAKRIAHAVRQSLNWAEFTLTDNALVLIQHRTTRVLTDPDGITTHAVIDFRSLIQREIAEDDGAESDGESDGESGAGVLSPDGSTLLSPDGSEVII